MKTGPLSSTLVSRLDHPRSSADNISSHQVPTRAVGLKCRDSIDFSLISLSCMILFVQISMLSESIVSKNSGEFWTRTPDVQSNFCTRNGAHDSLTRHKPSIPRPGTEHPELAPRLGLSIDVMTETYGTHPVAACHGRWASSKQWQPLTEPCACLKRRACLKRLMGLHTAPGQDACATKRPRILPSNTSSAVCDLCA